MVKIGRLMKNCEMFIRTLPDYSRLHRTDGRHDAHRRAGDQAHLAVGDHRLAGRDSAFDHDLVLHCLAGLDDAVYPPSVRLQNEHELALLAGLNGFRGNHRDAVQRAQRHDDVDELAGPEGAVGIGKFRFELDGAGGVVDQVIDEGECVRWSCVAWRDEGGDGEGIDLCCTCEFR